MDSQQLVQIIATRVEGDAFFSKVHNYLMHFSNMMQEVKEDVKLTRRDQGVRVLDLHETWQGVGRFHKGASFNIKRGCVKAFRPIGFLSKDTAMASFKF